MKTAEQIKPNHGPVYAAALYPDLCKIFQKHGYALAVHGSLARDFDVIAIPWVETPSSPDDIIAEVLKTFAADIIGEPGIKPHGRIAHTLSLGFGYCSMDLSFMPTSSSKQVLCGSHVVTADNPEGKRPLVDRPQS